MGEDVAVFSVSEAEAAMIRAAYEQDGELSATVEVRRLFPGVSSEAARRCARSIAGWKPPLALALPNRRERRANGPPRLLLRLGRGPFVQVFRQLTRLVARVFAMTTQPASGVTAAGFGGWRACGAGHVRRLGISHAAHSGWDD